jgi:hypothetical protein
MLDSIVLMPVSAFSNGIGVAAGFNGIISGFVGNYLLSITDANSCPVTATYELTQPSGRSELLFTLLC